MPSVCGIMNSLSKEAPNHPDLFLVSAGLTLEYYICNKISFLANLGISKSPTFNTFDADPVCV